MTTLNIGCNLQDSPPKISRSYPCAKKSAAGLLFSKKHHFSEHVKTQCFHAWFNKATKFLGIDNLTEKKLPVMAFVTSWSCSRISKRQLLIPQLWNPETQNTTVETRRTATFFGCLAKTAISFLVKKTLVNKANFFGPNSGHINGVPLYYFELVKSTSQVSPGNSFQYKRTENVQFCNWKITFTS